MNTRSTIGRFQGFALALLGACALTLAVSTVVARAGDMDETAKALVRLDEEWSKTAATRDADKVAAFYSEDAVVYPPDAPVVEGRAAAKKVWAGYFADPNFVKISWKSTHAEIAKSGEFGFTSGTYEMSLKGADGKPATEKGKFLCVWKKQADGTWKAVHDMWNADGK